MNTVKAAMIVAQMRGTLDSVIKEVPSSSTAWWLRGQVKELESCFGERGQTLAENHQFQNQMTIPPRWYIVIRTDNVPHMPSRVYSTITEANQRAEELAIKTGMQFAVLCITGVVDAAPRPKVTWTR